MDEARFDTSWSRAEAAVYAHLVDVTGAVDRKSAFLGYLPEMVNVWALNTGKSGNEQTLWSPDIVSVHLQAELVGQFAERARAQSWGMQIVRALPFKNLGTEEGNVQSFRIRQGGFQEPQLDFVELPNEKGRIPVFSLVIGCELVFSTGGRLKG
jgi:hypothetical protein